MCAQPTQPEREEWKLSDESLQKHLDDPAELLAFAENLDMDIGPLFGRDVAAVVRALLAERDRLAEALAHREEAMRVALRSLGGGPLRYGFAYDALDRALASGVGTEETSGTLNRGFMSLPGKRVGTEETNR